MLKVAIAGAGVLGQYVYDRVKQYALVVRVVDNNSNLWGRPMHGLDKDTPQGIIITAPDGKLSEQVDLVYVANKNHYREICKQLTTQCGVPDYKLVTFYSEAADMVNEKEVSIEPECFDARTRFLNMFAQQVYNLGITGNVAELGVFRGDFAKEINRAFPDRTFYLFDTFQGFDPKDVEYEINNGMRNGKTDQTMMHSFTRCTIEGVLDKLPYRKNVSVKQGYFPETFDLENETFCFVNLDMDLYTPIKEGLERFYPQMVRGGVILVHDYYSYGAVYKAVDNFVQTHSVGLVPAGDFLSVAIVKV